MEPLSVKGPPAQQNAQVAMNVLCAFEIVRPKDHACCSNSSEHTFLAVIYCGLHRSPENRVSSESRAFGEYFQCRLPGHHGARNDRPDALHRHQASNMALGS